jgi:hypothetical protein
MLLTPSSEPIRAFTGDHGRVYEVDSTGRVVNL